MHYFKRWCRTKVESGTQGASTTIIVGAYEKETKGSTVIHRVQVGDSVLIETKDNVQSTLFLIKDHLGSLVTVVDSLGTIKERLSYDPWGKRRAPTGASIDLLTLQTIYTDRGYTGHLHADGVGLIHMNGRMYDPILARFISADPLIQAPNNLQSLNRYSYVMNNPLSYTDPTGYSWSKFRDKWLKPIAAIAISVYMPQMLVKTYGITAGAASFITGGIVGYAQTGTLQGAFMGAWTGASFHAAGGISDATLKGAAQKMLAHAMVGGISSAANGGTFKSGFISAGLTAAATSAGLTEDISSALGGGQASQAGNVIAGALIGGVASKASGGDFAYGAVMAAMQQVMNHGAHRRAAQARSYLGVVGNAIKGQLTSEHEKELFENYWQGNGDTVLEISKFRGVANAAQSLTVTSETIVPIGEGRYTAKVISFYGNADLDQAYGRATLFYDANSNAVGFRDTYDFDSKNWGIRPTQSEIQTRAVNFSGKIFGNAKPYGICFGVGCY
jgi:RHS repeat-associated protein